MAKKAKRKSPSFKSFYTNYKVQNRWLKNRIARLERVYKAQPNNEQVQVALGVAISNKAMYSRNKHGDNTCKNMYKMFGYDKNHSTKNTPYSKLWHSSHYSKWFKPSAPKTKPYNNSLYSIGTSLGWQAEKWKV